jgi:hypothetical protein
MCLTRHAVPEGYEEYGQHGPWQHFTLVIDWSSWPTSSLRETLYALSMAGY